MTLHDVLNVLGMIALYVGLASWHREVVNGCLVSVQPIYMFQAV